MATATNPAPTSAPHSLRNNNNTNTDSGASPRRSPPWTQIVRGGESEPAAPAITLSSSPPPPLSLSSSAEASEQIVNNDWSPSKAPAGISTSPEADSVAAETLIENTDNAAKKAVWNKPSNGAAVEVISPVMGAVSWPALSESTNKASPKSLSSSDLFKDGSISLSQGTGMAFSSSSSPKQVNSNNTNASSTPNHVGPPTRQRSMKRGGGNPSNNASANGGLPQLQQPLQGGSVVESATNNSGKWGNSGTESASRENNHRDGGQQRFSGNEQHQQQRNSYRRGNGGPHPRGDGSYNHRYGGRGDQERGNQDWNSNRSFGSRDAHMQHQRGPARPFVRGPPHSSPHYMAPPMHVRPHFGTPMVFPGEVSGNLIYVPTIPPDPHRLPMMAPLQPVFFHMPTDPQLVSKIVTQIDYYFSNENLIKDTFLRKNMDEQGWVPVNLIAGFKKVMQLTDNLQLILDSVRSSTVVEVQGEKIRRRTDWMKWIMPPSVQYSTALSQSQQKSSTDSLAEHLQSVAFEEKTEHLTYLSRSSSADFSSSSKQSDSEIAEQTVGQRGLPMPFGDPSK